MTGVSSVKVHTEIGEGPRLRWEFTAHERSGIFVARDADYKIVIWRTSTTPARGEGHQRVELQIARADAAGRYSEIYRRKYEAENFAAAITFIRCMRDQIEQQLAAGFDFEAEGRMLQRAEAVRQEHAAQASSDGLTGLLGMAAAAILAYIIFA